MLKLLNAQTGAIIYNLYANIGISHILKRATTLYFFKLPLLSLHSYPFSSNQTSQACNLKFRIARQAILIIHRHGNVIYSHLAVRIN